MTLITKKLNCSLKQTPVKLSKLKPRNWGKGTERLSENVDKILYCD